MEDIMLVNKLKPDYIGFVFAKSKRQVSLEEAKYLKEKLSSEIKAVGVFVNEPIESLLSYAKEEVIDLIQLHGEESLDYIKSLKNKVKLPIIKAVRMPQVVGGDVKGIREIIGRYIKETEALPVDYILFDTLLKDGYGGSGESFDWSLLEKIKIPFFLAGGIGMHNIQEALKQGAYGIDVSSSVETDGFKDNQKVKSLIESIK